MRILLILLLTIVLVSCKDEEETYPFDQSPYVEFEELVFYDNQQGVDTLALSFIVWDREGDIGLEDSDLNPPYHYFNLIVDENDTPVTISENFNPPFYSMPMTTVFNPSTGQEAFYFFQEDKISFSEVDNRPDYSCDSYLVFDSPLIDYDTLMGSVNQNRNSLQIDFITEQGEKFNFQEIFNTDDCNIGNFDTVMPRFDGVSFFNKLRTGVFEIQKKDKYSYRVTYNIQAVMINHVFSDHQLEIQFQVLDRELNKSNFGNSGLVTLEEITN